MTQKIALIVSNICNTYGGGHYDRIHLVCDENWAVDCPDFVPSSSEYWEEYVQKDYLSSQEDVTLDVYLDMDPISGNESLCIATVVGLAKAIDRYSKILGKVVMISQSENVDITDVIR